MRRENGRLPRPTAGALGETLVEAALLYRGWSVGRPLNAHEVNVDLIIAKESVRRTIQVKLGQHDQRVPLGGYYKDGVRVTNQKLGVKADFYVLIALQNEREWTAWVIPSGRLEEIAPKHLKSFANRPKADGGQRKPFPNDVWAKRWPEMKPYCEAWHLLDGQG